MTSLVLTGYRRLCAALQNSNSKLSNPAMQLRPMCEHGEVVSHNHNTLYVYTCQWKFLDWIIWCCLVSKYHQLTSPLTELLEYSAVIQHLHRRRDETGLCTKYPSAARFFTLTPHKEVALARVWQELTRREKTKRDLRRAEITPIVHTPWREIQRCCGDDVDAHSWSFYGTSLTNWLDL